MIHFGLQLGRNWIYIFTFHFFSLIFFLILLFCSKPLDVFILLLVINCSRHCLSFSTRIVFEWRKQINWSRSSSTGQRKSHEHMRRWRRRRLWQHTFAIYSRIHSSLTTKIARWWNEKKRRKQKQQNTLSWLRFIQCHRHAAATAVAV